MLAPIDDVWVDATYRLAKSGAPAPDCKNVLAQTVRQLLSPTDPSLPLADFAQPAILRIGRFFESPSLGDDPRAGTHEPASDVVLRHTKIHVEIDDASNTKIAYCNDKLLNF